MGHVSFNLNGLHQYADSLSYLRHIIRDWVDLHSEFRVAGLLLSLSQFCKAGVYKDIVKFMNRSPKD